MLYDDYIEYTNKYKAIYGDDTLVLMEVGSFFELYGVETPTLCEGANVSAICDLLGIQMSKKNKNIPECSRTNPYMAGFPNHVLKKFMDILVGANYTVVLVEQVTPPPHPQRSVTQIVSPSTYMDNVPLADNQFLMAMYFSVAHTKQRKPFLTAACAWVDPTTGVSYVYESCMYDTDHGVVLDDMNRMLLCQRPKELLLFADGALNKTPYAAMLMDWSARLQVACVHNRLQHIIADNFFSVSYQNVVLKKVFPHTGLLSPIEYVELERKHYGLIAYVYMIQFAYEHSEKIVVGLKKPCIIEHDQYMLLNNQCVEHLNIVSSKGGKTGSLNSLLNNCQTMMGKRYFTQCLLAPLTTPRAMQERYDLIDMLLGNDLYKTCKQSLGSIHDVERLFKRLCMGVLQPCEFYMIHQSLQHFMQLMLAIENIHDRVGWHCNDDVQTWMQQYTTLFNLEAMSAVNLVQVCNSFYNRGIHGEIDDLEDAVQHHTNIFVEFCDALNTGVTEPEFKLEISEKGERSILITKKRYDTFVGDGKRYKKVKELLLAQGIDEIETKPVSAANKTMLKVTFKDMYAVQGRLASYQSQLKSVISTAYVHDLLQFANDYSILFHSIVNVISKIDMLSTCAYNANKYNYKRPQLLTYVGSESCINATCVRHPLIEVIQKDIPYIANDIVIGSETEKGMLLYGINAVGKSSFMKSVGMNLIMAQAGMYVACNSFKFVPYMHIFTRIPGGDNLFKGHSTFVSEMHELRTILKKADARSMVIGDELCSGTESVSAVSIVAAGIAHLSKKNASFIFATHLHEVADLQCIKELSNVHVYHMKVSYENDSGVLVYDRKLHRGQGDTLYGLEVCKSLDLPPEFLHSANIVRQEYMNMSAMWVNTKKSTYSADVYVDVCGICKTRAEEVHHIKEQHLASSTQFIDNTHKNHKSNLIPVCQRCHDMIHAQRIRVQGFQQTSQGIVLQTQHHDGQIDLSAKVKEMRLAGVSIAKIVEALKALDNSVTQYKVQKWLK